MSPRFHSVDIIDTHTGGEPTRVVIGGGPDLGKGSLRQRLQRMRRESDEFRRMLIDEPRGHEAIVAAVMCEPTDPSCVAGVIFLNNLGYLGMCGHGAIGVAAALAYQGRIATGSHRLETPVGVVTIHLHDRNRVSIENVPSYRLHHNVQVDTGDFGTLRGDVAWGGNWFFLTESPVPLSPTHLDQLILGARDVRDSLTRAGIRGADGAEIDHIEFFGAPDSAGADSCNFVLCPGGAYDRSPCGTGTSAKLACLAADGQLEPGHSWVQQSIIGSRFVASYRNGEGNQIVPTITGSAYVYGESRLIVQDGDPFAYGIGRTKEQDVPTPE